FCLTLTLTLLPAMTLTDLGLTDEIIAYINNNNLSGFALGRVTQEHRERLTRYLRLYKKVRHIV
ncbi:MAG TPA: hypothetical protein VIK07_03640, partial [Bacteroidales bacterium]